MNSTVSHATITSRGRRGEQDVVVVVEADAQQARGRTVQRRVAADVVHEPDQRRLDDDERDQHAHERDDLVAQQGPEADAERAEVGRADEVAPQHVEQPGEVERVDVAHAEDRRADDHQRHGDDERQHRAGDRVGDELRREQPQPVGRRQHRARDRAMAPLAGDPHDAEQEDEQRREVAREHRLRSSSSKRSCNSALSTSSSSDSSTPAPTSAANVRVVRSFSSSARSSALTPAPARRR